MAKRKVQYVFRVRQRNGEWSTYSQTFTTMECALKWLNRFKSITNKTISRTLTLCTMQPGLNTHNVYKKVKDYILLIVLFVSLSAISQNRRSPEFYGAPFYGRIWQVQDLTPEVNVTVTNKTTTVIAQSENTIPHYEVKLDTTLWVNRKEQRSKSTDELLKQLKYEN